VLVDGVLLVLVVHASVQLAPDPAPVDRADG